MGHAPGDQSGEGRPRRWAHTARGDDRLRKGALLGGHHGDPGAGQPRPAQRARAGEGDRSQEDPDEDPAALFVRAHESRSIGDEDTRRQITALGGAPGGDSPENLVITE
jgi:hypothetical protein